MARTSLARVPFGTLSEKTAQRIKTAEQAAQASHATHSYDTRYRELQSQFEEKLAELRTEYLGELASIAAGAEE